MHRNRVKPWKPKTKRGSDSWFFILLLVAAISLVGYYWVQRRLGNNLLVTSAATPRAGLTITPTRSTEDFIILAQQAELDGHFREAIGLYDQASRRRPNDIALQVRPALLLAYSGQYAKAEQRSRRMLQSNPKNVLARVVLCYALQYQRQLDAGLAECQTATTDDPNSAMAWAYLAEAQADKNDCTNARTSAQQAVDLEPTNVDALHKLGYYYEVCEQNFPTALEYYQKARDLAPNMAPVLIDIGRLQLNLTNTQEATKAFQHIIEADDQNAEAYSRLGIVNMTIGEYSEALKQQDRAVELEPGRAWFWTNRGWLNFRRFFFPEAAADYAKALAASKVSQEPLKPIDYLRYGYALTEAKQCDEGRAMLAKAVEMAPGDATFIDTQTSGLENCDK